MKKNTQKVKGEEKKLDKQKILKAVIATFLIIFMVFSVCGTLIFTILHK